MKFGKLTGLLLLTVLLTACTAEQTGPPAYVEPEETTAVRISPEKSDSPDVSDYQIPRKKGMVIREEAEEESPDEIEDHDPPQMIAAEPDALPQEQESSPADSNQNADSEVFSHVHAYEAETVEASCTEGGYTRYRCACGDSYTGDMVPPLGHAYQETVIAPTAEAEGDTLHTCSRCGDTYRDQETPTLQIRYDVEAAMAAGNAHAQVLGFSLDFSLSPGDVAGYSPPMVVSGDTIAELGGQAWLNQCAAEAVQYEYDCILGVDGILGETRGRSYITYDSCTDTYTVYFLYG